MPAKKLIDFKPADISRIQKSLSALAAGVQEKGVIKATKRIGNVMKKEMAARSPVDHDDPWSYERSLAESVNVRKLTKGGKQRLGIKADYAVIVGPNKKTDETKSKNKHRTWSQAYKGAFFEFGKGKIPAGHPGIGYMSRTLDENTNKAGKIFYNSLNDYIRKLKV